MERQPFGNYLNPDGHERPVGAVAIVNPDGSPIVRNELGLTLFEAKVISLLAQIRDRLPEPAAKSAAKPKA